MSSISDCTLNKYTHVPGRSSAAAKASSKASTASPVSEQDAVDLLEDDLLEAVVRSAATPCADVRPRERRRARTERKSCMFEVIMICLAFNR